MTVLLRKHHAKQLHYKNKDGISIKDYILQKAENPEDDGYYKNPDFLHLVEQIKQYQ